VGNLPGRGAAVCRTGPSAGTSIVSFVLGGDKLLVGEELEVRAKVHFERRRSGRATNLTEGFEEAAEQSLDALENAPGDGERDACPTVVWTRVAFQTIREYDLRQRSDRKNCLGR
jgi:hypothetical protein